MLNEEKHEYPEHINCSEVIQIGGRIKSGNVSKTELEDDEEIRVSIRSTRLPSVEIFTIRNLEPADYQVILVAIPKKKGSN